MPGGAKKSQKPLAISELRDIKNVEEWLNKQDREIAEVIAARAATRIIPKIWVESSKFRSDIGPLRFLDLSLSIFRALSSTWVALQYNDRKSEIKLNADASVLLLDQFYKIAYKNDCEEQKILSSVAYAADAAMARNTAASISAALGAVAGSYAADSLHLGGESINAVGFDIVKTTSMSPIDILKLPIWPTAIPSYFYSAWQNLQREFPPDENWDVWVRWYEDRLRGNLRSEASELVYASVPMLRWDVGAKTVNSWIRDNLPSDVPETIDNVPSDLPVSLTPSGQITIAPGPQNIPETLSDVRASDHIHWLNDQRTVVSRLINDIDSDKFGNSLRAAYVEFLSRYLSDLPVSAGTGNFGLADRSMRALRSMYEIEAGLLPEAFVGQFVVIHSDHLKLLEFYPSVSRLRATISELKPTEQLPEQAMEAFQEFIDRNTPSKFDPAVQAALNSESQKIPVINIHPDDVPSSAKIIRLNNETTPSPDLAKEKAYKTAALANSIVKIISLGSGIVGWAKITEELYNVAGPLINWLRGVLSG